VRIVFNTTFEEGIRSITRASENLVEAQRQVASGRRLNQLSDDPLGATVAVSEHTTLARIDAYSGASDAASYRLGLADAVLTDVIEQLTAAQTIALGARGTSATQAQRDAAANQLLSIRDALLSDINTQIQGVYLFSGSQVTTPPFVAGGSGMSAYQGDSTPMTIDVGEHRAVAITVDGGSLFQGGDASHVLDALTALAAAVTAGDATGIAAGADAINRTFDRAVAAQASVGNGLRALDDNRGQLTAARTAATTRLSKVEEADLAQAAGRMAQADTAYRAALQALATSGRISLLDYLR
jgi:flagellar hook-associated protein 3 FlgL